ncbi:MAG: hypothetical protein RL329_2555 [Bacteroidota bacterium]|jgi:hypothetical protein
MLHPVFFPKWSQIWFNRFFLNVLKIDNQYFDSKFLKVEF